jgi:O-antigen ligase
VRGNFWSVALSAFGDHPIRGLGAGGFEAEWRRRRTILYSARDSHSLYLETLSELGIVGMLALVTVVVGVAACARRAFRLDPALSAGWIAVVTAWAVHAGLDWDWEMPTVSLFGFALVAAIVAQADAGSTPAGAPVAVSAPEMTAVAGGVEP